MELLARPLDELCAEARALRDEGHGPLLTYSPKVFIPLTKLCRDVCHYCTFARPPRRGERAYLSIDEVLEIARAGAAPLGAWRSALRLTGQTSVPPSGDDRGRRGRARPLHDGAPDRDRRVS